VWRQAGGKAPIGNRENPGEFDRAEAAVKSLTRRALFGTLRVL